MSTNQPDFQGIVKAVNISKTKGVQKENIHTATINMQGVEADAHAGDWHRQVSLLAEESIERMRALGLTLRFGDFAENITSAGLTLHKLPIGTRFHINDVILELTQIGKECHAGCAIMQKSGKCIMPTEGIFTKVITPGTISEGQEIMVYLPTPRS